MFISGYAYTENVFYCLNSTLIWQTRDNNDVSGVVSCLYAPPRPTQSRSYSCRITHVRHVSGHSGIPRFATSQAKPVKIIGQTNFNKVNAPHNVPVTERNGIFTRVLFPRILLYSFME